MSIAIIGAGVAGLACARALAERGYSVRLFDKGRCVGGRLATRRVGEHAFDLGAQYFTVRDERFADATRATSAVWNARIAALGARGEVGDVAPAERWVGVPSMSAIGKHLARGLDVRTSHRVDRILRVRGRFSLSGTAAPHDVTLAPSSGYGTDALGTFDRLIVTVPAPQAIALLGRASSPLDAVRFAPCFAVGIRADALRDVPFDGLFVTSKILSWAARDSSKPGRAPGERWVLHSTSEWAAETAEDAAGDAMVAELSRLLGVAIAPTVSVIRRWSLARASRIVEGPVVHDGILVGGDWMRESRIEDAYLAGLALADAV